jgi:HD superfamily phosphodiesterase
MKMLNDIFKFVMSTSIKHKIDESHGLSHSMNVLQFAHSIFEYEKKIVPNVVKYQRVIYVSAALHDMCDNKYMDVDEGIKTIEHFLQDKLSSNEIEITKEIICTMSYSKVKVSGFPVLGDYQHAYHIVREADLFSAYDFDRCMIYHMNHNSKNIDDAFLDASQLFNRRMLKHNEDRLFVTEYSRNNYKQLHDNAIIRIENWRQLLDSCSK